MSYVLTKDGAEIAKSASWNPKLFSNKTGVSFPREVTDGYSWEGEGFSLVWVEDPPVPNVPYVPQVVTMRQARLALYDVGKLNQINGMINAMIGVAGDKARIEWEYGSTVDRNSPLTAAIAAQLNMTSAEMDTLFTTAATL